MKTPGTYTYEDNRRRKKSHNKSDQKIFVNKVGRFETYENKTPGPGTYFGDD